MARTTNICVNLTCESIARLDELAGAAGASRSWVLRRLLEPALTASNVELIAAEATATRLQAVPLNGNNP
jgi:predicted transcriptional regulator